MHLERENIFYVQIEKLQHKVCNRDFLNQVNCSHVLEIGAQDLCMFACFFGLYAASRVSIIKLDMRLEQENVGCRDVFRNGTAQEN
jgi:hypothetical protein